MLVLPSEQQVLCLPMKRVRINTVQYRAWRKNVPKIVEPDGLTELREVTEYETKILNELTKRAKHLRENQDYIENEGQEDELRVAVELIAVNPTTIMMKRLINGKEVVDHRTLFKKQLLEKYGECQMRGITGQFLPNGAIRDPRKYRGTAGVSTNTPRPEVCDCEPWAGPDGRPHPGRHHRVCRFNEKAPLEERALDGGGIVIDDTMRTGDGVPASPPRLPIRAPGGVFRSSGKPVGLTGTKPASQAVGQVGGVVDTTTAVPLIVESAVATPLAVPAALAAPVVKEPLTPLNARDDQVPTPEKCSNECFLWAPLPASQEGHHHPVCQWEERWKLIAAARPATTAAVSGLENATHVVAPAYVLVDLETKQPLRRASLEEIAEASGERGYCVVAEKPYAVVPQSDISP